MINFFFFFFFVVLGFELTKYVLYHLSHTFNPKVKFLNLVSGDIFV
jgi:hypothetical protein